MRKKLKIFLIILLSLIAIILVDSGQAIIFNNNPFIGIESKCMMKKGIFVHTYHCGNGQNITKFRFFSSSCNQEEVCRSSYEANNSYLEKQIKNDFYKMYEVSNLASSNPYDYIKNDYYKDIVSLGSSAVSILIKMYDKGELSSLDAYIGAIAIEEITKCNLREQYGLNWSTPNEFYTLWKDNQCRFTNDFIIVDKSKEITDFACDTALEPFYEDNKYRYSYGCIMSDYIVVRYNSGQEETVKEALKKHRITIEDLDKFQIKYIKQEKR